VRAGRRFSEKEMRKWLMNFLDRRRARKKARIIHMMDNIICNAFIASGAGGRGEDVWLSIEGELLSQRAYSQVVKRERGLYIELKNGKVALLLAKQMEAVIRVIKRDF
jgi:hypothetical protein